MIEIQASMRVERENLKLLTNRKWRRYIFHFLLMLWFVSQYVTAFNCYVNFLSLFIVYRCFRIVCNAFLVISLFFLLCITLRDSGLHFSGTHLFYILHYTITKHNEKGLTYLIFFFWFNNTN